MGKDTSEGIAAELVGAGLVDPHDSVAISMNLAKLLDAQIASENAPKTITFHLVSETSNTLQYDKDSTRPSGHMTQSV